MGNAMARPIGPPRCAKTAALAGTAAVLAGCEGPQSALHTAGPDAAAYALLGNIMYAGATAIFILVMALTAYAIFASPERRAWLARRRIIVAGGIVFPIVTLSALLFYGFWILREAEWSEMGRVVRGTPSDGALRVEVIGEQFWWRVRYLDADGDVAFETANEIAIPTGRRVALRLTSADVIHSFWVPSLGGKIDMIPGRTTTLTLLADRDGIYRGQCAEFCGAQHARMAFHAVAMAPDRFERWLDQQRQPPPEPTDPFLRRGLEVFLSSGCGACHTVRGTEAAGTLGPDLTTMGSRPSVAAGTLPNNVGTLAGWIAASQHLKPGNLMPSFDALTGPDLRAVAAYLESLK
jgi:cytochrome c oxidase subunit II